MKLGIFVYALFNRLLCLLVVVDVLRINRQEIARLEETKMAVNLVSHISLETKSSAYVFLEYFANVILSFPILDNYTQLGENFLVYINNWWQTAKNSLELNLIGKLLWHLVIAQRITKHLENILQDSHVVSLGFVELLADGLLLLVALVHWLSRLLSERLIKVRTEYNRIEGMMTDRVICLVRCCLQMIGGIKEWRSQLVQLFLIPVVEL